jgi:hypothetical protein
MNTIPSLLILKNKFYNFSLYQIRTGTCFVKGNSTNPYTKRPLFINSLINKLIKRQK